nr:MAG TPA: hypothetical protein [Caudoviricetes sp.]
MNIHFSAIIREKSIEFTRTVADSKCRFGVDPPPRG